MSVPSWSTTPAKGEPGPGAGINHLVIQVESLDATRADLAAKGIEPEPIECPGGPAGPHRQHPEGSPAGPGQHGADARAGTGGIATGIYPARRHLYPDE